MRNSVAASTVPVTIVPRTLNEAPMCLARRNRRFLKAPWFLKITESFTSFETSWSFLPSHLTPLTAWMWSAVENYYLPVTAPIILQIARSELLYFSFADVTGLCRTIPDFFTDNVLRVPTIGGRVFDFPKKRLGKKVSCRKIPAPRTPVLYLSSRVAKIPTPIGPHMPPWRNSPEDILPPFFW